ncbi:hypothetical protein, partial [Peterkaempfera griseoplana]|uniref:hypothetical protein n=1 Tax=Peterkaempfera griseoplana TaxID=66896 RepID=UPI0006E2112A
AAVGLTAAGCSSGKGGSSGPAAKVLTKAQLQAAALTAEELPAGYRIVKPASADALFTSTSTTVPAQCQPIQDIGAGKPTAAWAQNYPQAAKRTQVLASRIASYPAGGAERTMADLEGALKHCAAFRAANNKDGSVTTVQVTPGKAPALGDDSVQLDLASSGGGSITSLRMVLVRTGTAIALFSAFDISSGKPVPLPQRILSAQVDKLKAATG